MDSRAFFENFNQARPAARAGYRLDEYLTEGGQAWIYSARHADGPAVIKAFKQAQSEEEVDTFLDEGRKLKELSACEFIAQVHWIDSIPVTFGRGRGKSIVRYPYMAMEYADGGSLRDYIGTEALTPEQSLTWLTQAMEGIRYAHGEHLADGIDDMSRVVHRDIKPANILIVNDKAKVTDFGVAVTGHKTDMTISRTQIGAGTLPYMSPEQFHGRAVLASDIYSMGIMGYQMLTGKLPIKREGGDYHDWYTAHQNVVPQQIDIRNADGSFNELAMQMQQVLMQAMAKHPRDRFASMGSFQQTLIASAAHASGTVFRKATHIDLAPTTDSSIPTERYEPTVVQTEELRTRLLTGTKQQTKELPPEPPELPEPTKWSRRRFLAIGGAASAVAAEEVIRRSVLPLFEHSPEAPKTPHERIVGTARWTIDRCKQLGRDNDVFYLVRDLIPIDYAAATEYIQKMPLETASWLAADLAQYDLAAAEKIMKKYEAKHDYVSATRIALGLAYYGKEKLHEKSSGFVSGVPIDPQRKAAYYAAERVKIQCNNQELQDILDIASSTTYAYSNFGQPIDRAAQKLEQLRKDGKTELVEMLCRVIARDASSDVADCLTYYAGLATGAITGDAHTQALQMAVNIATDLAPFAPGMVVPTFDLFAARSETDVKAAADAIAMALAPYAKTKVAAYVAASNYTYTNRLPIGIGAYQKMPGLASHMTEPITSWLRLAQDPSAANAQKAQSSLADKKDFASYAYWTTAGLLKSQTTHQK
ncbi:MAG TPA: serine/threonine-protein kinase [Candidatus Saccharimonadales bacterium]|nr:serine/threonine-protein kinase [Candidatus Saccharimonadales bacterium]